MIMISRLCVFHRCMFFAASSSWTYATICFFLLGVVPLECQAQVTGRFDWDWHWPSVNCAADPTHKKHLGDHQVMFTYLFIDTCQHKHVHYMHWWWHCLLCILILHRAKIPPNRSLVVARPQPSHPPVLFLALPMFVLTICDPRWPPCNSFQINCKTKPRFWKVPTLVFAHDGGTLWCGCLVSPRDQLLSPSWS